MRAHGRRRESPRAHESRRESPRAHESRRESPRAHESRWESPRVHESFRPNSCQLLFSFSLGLYALNHGSSPKNMWKLHLFKHRFCKVQQDWNARAGEPFKSYGTLSMELSSLVYAVFYISYLKFIVNTKHHQNPLRLSSQTWKRYSVTQNTQILGENDPRAKTLLIKKENQRLKQCNFYSTITVV